MNSNNAIPTKWQTHNNNSNSNNNINSNFFKHDHFNTRIKKLLLESFFVILVVKMSQHKVSFCNSEFFFLFERIDLILNDWWQISRLYIGCQSYKIQSTTNLLKNTFLWKTWLFIDKKHNTSIECVANALAYHCKIKETIF